MSLSQLGTRDVVTLSHEATVRDAVRWMVDANVGSVIVLRGRVPCGIVTDRDLVLRVLASGCSPDSTPITEIMSPALVYVGISLLVFYQQQPENMRAIWVASASGPNGRPTMVW